MNNNDAFAQIEDIVLQDDMRGMTALKPHMPDGYMWSRVRTYCLTIRARSSS